MPLPSHDNDNDSQGTGAGGCGVIDGRDQKQGGPQLIHPAGFEKVRLGKVMVDLPKLTETDMDQEDTTKTPQDQPPTFPPSRILLERGLLGEKYFASRQEFEAWKKLPWWRRLFS